MTSAPTTLTYCAGCGRLIPTSELQAGLSEAREAGVVCISCIEKSDPKRAATIREMSFREAERAKVSVQLMWAPPGVIPSRAARLAGETSPAPGSVDPISGEIGREPLGPALSPYGGPPVDLKPVKHIPWWAVGLGALCMAVLGALAERGIVGAPARPPAQADVPVTGVGPLAQPDPGDRGTNGSPQPLQRGQRAPEPGAQQAAPPTPPPRTNPPSPVTAPPPPVEQPAPAGVTPAGPNAADEERAKALLNNADEVFEKAPATAEKLYQNILDFYPQTAAATLARLRLNDLTAAADRTAESQLQGIFDAAMKGALPETYWETKTSAEALAAAQAHGPKSTALKPELTGKLEAKLDELRRALTAQGPLLVAGCIQEGNLARAEAILKAMDRFTDPTTIATASALHQQLDLAKVEADYKAKAPAIEAALKVAPYLRNFDQRIAAWDLAGAQRELDAADQAGMWDALGPDMKASMQTVAAYIGGPFRDELMRKAKQVAAAKAPVTVRMGGLGLDNNWGTLRGNTRRGQVQSGPVLNWVTTDSFTQSVNGKDRRVFWRLAAAESLYELARFQPADLALEGPEAEAARAADGDLVGAIGAVATARGETSAAGAAEQYVGAANWQRFARLRLTLEAESRGAAIVTQLAQAVQTEAVLGALYGLRASTDLLRDHPAPLAFLAPEGRAALGDARSLVRAKNGGSLLVFENYRLPTGTFTGLRLAQLSERGGADPAAALLTLGADGGAQRVMLHLENIRVPAGQVVQQAFLRIRDLEVMQAGSNATPPTPMDILGVTLLPRPADWSHFTWDFCDTLHGLRWPRPGADVDSKETPMRAVEGPPVGANDVVIDITPYFAALANTDYTEVGNGLLLKVIKNEPDYRVTFPHPRLPNSGGSSVAVELVLAPKGK